MSNQPLMKIFLGLLVAGLYLGISPAFADQVSEALIANRHASPSVQELEKLAGGHDALIARLLELRADDSHPLLGMRAARILLENFRGEANIAAAFAEDLSRDDRAGIAQYIALNIDKVPSAAARSQLARSVVEKAKRDAKYAKYAKNLAASNDASVKQLAKELE